jgi:hypothetical protein
LHPIFDPNIDVTEDDSKEDEENINTSATTLEPRKPTMPLSTQAQPCTASFVLSSNSNPFVSSTNNALFVHQLLIVSLTERCRLSTAACGRHRWWVCEHDGSQGQNNLKQQQRLEQERRAKHKHVEQLNAICNHGGDIIAANRIAQERVMQLGRSVLAFHATTEKEEQKCIERLAKERLRVAKADDEEAYIIMKLIDTAKDTRITHLLRQTDSYLDYLAQAVVAQQSEHGHIIVEHGFETEDGPASGCTSESGRYRY